jgi:hypothetical protein
MPRTVLVALCGSIPGTEQVIDDDEANRLLRDGDRGCRIPFDVPEKL